MGKMLFRELEKKLSNTETTMECQSTVKCWLIELEATSTHILYTEATDLLVSPSLYLLAITVFTNCIRWTVTVKSS
jgi:hypothetical protein